MTKSRKWTLGAVALGVVGAAAYGITTANGASTNLDPSRLATVERGPMVRSVVATGKVEPITKVEIKSKANGIIERLSVDVDHHVEPGQILAELDKETLRARLREARANLEAARAAHAAAEAQAAKHDIEAEAPDVAFAKAAFDRARSLNEQKLVSQESLDQAHTDLRSGPQPPARGRFSGTHRARQGERSPRPGRAGRGRSSSGRMRSWPTPPSRPRSAAPS